MRIEDDNRRAKRQNDIGDGGHRVRPRSVLKEIGPENDFLRARWLNLPLNKRRDIPG
jgi:hypothetical protein